MSLSRSPTSSVSRSADRTSIQKRNSNRPRNYRPRRTPRQRVDDIQKSLRTGEHQWSIADLLCYYITTDSPQPRTESSRARCGKVVDTIFKDEAALDAFVGRILEEEKYRNQLVDRLVNTLRREQQQLHELVEEFGSLEPAVDLTDKLHLQNACLQISTNAPVLNRILTKLTINQYATNGETESTNHGPRVFMIIGILNFCYSRQKGSLLQKQLGLYIKGQLGKRRLINVLSTLGITDSWSSLERFQKIVAEKAKELLQLHIKRFGKSPGGPVTQFDNWELYQTTHSHSTGNHDKMFSMTTGKIYKGICMPANGLKQFMYHKERMLSLAEIQGSPGLDYSFVVHNTNIHQAVCMNFIATAIATTYPKEVMQIFGKAKNRPWSSVEAFPQPPSIDRLKKQQTTQATLELIMENEGTIEGTHNILEDIFGRQLGKDKALDFGEELYLVGGDQATIKNILAVQRECATDEDPYDRKAWLLPVPGLFHFRMHIIDAIKTTYWGSDEQWAPSMLKTHSIVMNRKQLPVYDIPFSFTESLVRDSAYARIMGFVYVLLQDGIGTSAISNHDTGISFQSRPSVAEHIRHWNPQRFNAVVRRVYQEAFAPQQQRPAADVLGGIPEGTLREQQEATKTANKRKRKSRGSRKPTRQNGGGGGDTPTGLQEPLSQEGTSGPREREITTVLGLQMERVSTRDLSQNDIDSSPRNISTSFQSTASQQESRDSGLESSVVEAIETGHGDEERHTHIQYLYWTSTYFALTDAIKHADIGMIRWAVDRAIVLFQAESKRNYAFISKWMKRIGDSPAADKELQTAFLANMLVNTGGREDGWFEADRLVELLNLAMRNAAESKSTGSFDVETQMKAASLWVNTHSFLRDSIERELGYKANNKHTQRDMTQDIHNLAYKLSLHSIRPAPPGLPMPWRPLDLVSIGMRRLIDGGMAGFNTRVVHRQGQFDYYRLFRSGRHEDENSGYNNSTAEDAVIMSDREYEELNGLGAVPTEDLVASSLIL